MTHKSGYIALVGPPNVGKSTLLNTLIHEKLAIVTNKPQTTRKRFLGIRTTAASQMIFVDTPGFHQSGKKLNQFMFQEIEGAFRDVDVICYLVAADRGTSREYGEFIEGNRKKYPGKKSLMVINKIDLLDSPKEYIFSHGSTLSPSPGVGAVPCDRPQKGQTHGSAPTIQTDALLLRDAEEKLLISATKGMGLDLLTEKIESLLPEGPLYFPEDQLTDVNLRDIATEIIREKAMEFTFEEIPYSIAVGLESFQEASDLTRIHATLFVEHESQKGMVVGKGGAKIKQIGTAARLELEKLLQKKVFLELQVKIDKNWTKDATKMARYGYILKNSNQKRGDQR